MSKYIMRLDDACEKMDIEKWGRMENLLDRYDVKPLVGVIPHCEDIMMNGYPEDTDFWGKVKRWTDKNWTIAMHGYNHVYSTQSGGINPVNSRSEFAGECLEVQKEKIEKGVAILREHGIDPQVFFAPSHTFDENTIVALKECSNIRIISDTIADKPYSKYGMTFVPQQSGRVRTLPFHMVTFCYHPNMMGDKEFEVLEVFLKENSMLFVGFPLEQANQGYSFFDTIVKHCYFARRTQK